MDIWEENLNPGHYNNPGEIEMKSTVTTDLFAIDRSWSDTYGQNISVNHVLNVFTNGSHLGATGQA